MKKKLVKQLIMVSVLALALGNPTLVHAKSDENCEVTEVESKVTGENTDDSSGHSDEDKPDKPETPKVTPSKTLPDGAKKSSAYADEVECAVILIDSNGKELTDHKVGAHTEFTVRLCLPEGIGKLNGALWSEYPFEIEEGETGEVQIFFTQLTQEGMVKYSGSVDIIAKDDLVLEHGMKYTGALYSGRTFLTDDYEIGYSLYSTGSHLRAPSNSSISQWEGHFNYTITPACNVEYKLDEVATGNLETMSHGLKVSRYTDEYGIGDPLPKDENGYIHLKGDQQYCVAWDTRSQCNAEDVPSAWRLKATYTFDVTKGNEGIIEVLLVNPDGSEEYVGRQKFIADNHVFLEYVPHEVDIEAPVGTDFIGYFGGHSGDFLLTTAGGPSRSTTVINAYTHQVYKSTNY